MNEKAKIYAKVFIKSKWAFPAILFMVVVVLSLLKIHGSSIGVYHNFFYGESIKDSNLIANKPQPIRSDEWLVGTQLTLAQIETGFKGENPNLGTGMDVSLMLDTPTKSVMQIFKPQNLGFFIFPKDIAFALKWWMAFYLLAISIYLFVLVILPNKVKLAILLAMGFAMSPFFIWWYGVGTLGVVYYAIFGIIIILKIIRSKSWKTSVSLGVLLSYIATCFALLVYPPFQIPVMLVALSFLIGYSIDNRKQFIKNIKNITIGGAIAIILTILWLAIALVPRQAVLDTINGTTYPGKRVVASGFSEPHEVILLFSGNISPLMQSQSRANALAWAPNQSEASTFHIIGLILLPVLLYCAIKYKRKLSNYWTIVSMSGVLGVFLVWILIPGADFLGTYTFLNIVPQVRLLIGVGLVSFMLLILTIQTLQGGLIKIKKPLPGIYAATLFFIYLVINMVISYYSPEFMGWKWAILLAIPYALVVYLILEKKFITGLIVLLVFSILSVAFIHPLYRGFDVLVESKLSKTIREIDPEGESVWAADTLILENIALVNGKKSLTGTYLYPDNKLWGEYFIGEEARYNRFAHVVVNIDRDEEVIIDTTMNNPQGDMLVVTTEMCSAFLSEFRIGYIIAREPIAETQTSCASLVKELIMPAMTIYIYKIN